MAELIFRPQASADLADIYAYSVTNFGVETARSYHAGLRAATAHLAEHPQLGAVYPGVRPAIRYLPYRRHHIFYDFDGATVWVVRILHHAMDAGRLL